MVHIKKGQICDPKDIEMLHGQQMKQLTKVAINN